MPEHSEFAGFPAGRLACTPVPDVFLASVLPRIAAAGTAGLLELQVTLQAFRLLSRKQGWPRWLTAAELLADPALLAGLRALAGPGGSGGVGGLGGPGGQDGAGGATPAAGTREAREPYPASAGLAAEAALLAAGLGRAVERGTLLRLAVEREQRTVELYFANGEQGRRAVAAALAGELDLGERVVAPEPAAAPAPRLDVYALYEQNVGLLTPLLAEELAAAERLYPADWLEAAFRQAVAYNRRSWKYVQRILERWAVEGRQDEETGRGTGGATAAPAHRPQRRSRTGHAAPGR